MNIPKSFPAIAEKMMDSPGFYSKHLMKSIPDIRDKLKNFKLSLSEWCHYGYILEHLLVLTRDNEDCIEIISIGYEFFIEPFR